MSIVTPRAQPQWLFEALAHDGTPLGALIGRARKLTRGLNSPGSASITLGLDEAGRLADRLRVAEVDLLVWRNDWRWFRGPLMAAEASIAPGRGEVTFVAIGLWELLGERIIPPGREILATEQTQMAWQLIADSQALPAGDLGIVAGELPASVARSRTWDTPMSVRAAIEELAGLEDGFDHSISPQQQGEGEGYRFDAHYPAQGLDRGLVLEYGRNLSALTLRVDATIGRLRNRVIARTASQIGVVAEDLTSQGLHRLREVEVSGGDMDRADVLGALARAELRPAPVRTPRLTCLPGRVSLDDVGLGDPVQVEAHRGWLALRGAHRVAQIDVSIPDDGGHETLEVSVQEPA